MVTKLTSSNELIAKVIADLDLAESDVRISDIVEWIGEGLEHIGGVWMYSKEVSGVTDESVLEVCGYQAALPCNIKDLISVAYSQSPHGGWRPCRVSTNVFDRWGGNSNMSPDHYDHSHDCFSIARLYMDMQAGIMNPHCALYEINHNPNIKQTLQQLIEKGDYKWTPRNRGGHSTDFTRDITYSVKPGYININVDSGFLKIAYSTIPVDKDGYPMIPDIAAVKEAVYWYVTMKLMYPKYLYGVIPHHVYLDMKMNWTKWANSANAKLKMPNIDELNTMKNIHTSLMPRMNEEQTFLDTAGEKEKLYDYGRRHGWYYQNPRMTHGWN
ncbi:hypothetical protein AGMMS50239_26080 [Bacteroidia bacterium]|nr:hypothetical protein AGMMS50239_26080 [Bacteroidia bacterium]